MSKVLKMALSISQSGAHTKEILIHSGASCNIIDKQTWEDLKRQGIKVFLYGSRKPLETLGKYNSVMPFNKEETEVQFVVISGKGRPLLGRKTAMQLGVLKLG